MNDHVLKLNKDEALLVCTALAKLRDEFRASVKTEGVGSKLPGVTPDVISAWKANASTADRLYEELLGSVMEASI